MLTVFNHPLWDEMRIGEQQHRMAAIALLSQYGEYLHAIELNGLRPWRENSSVIRLARDWGKPVVSGGDRHVVEPNATLNLTSTGNFAEFVSEIRSGWSDVLLMPHYRIPHSVRVLHNILDVFRTYEPTSSVGRNGRIASSIRCATDPSPRCPSCGETVRRFRRESSPGLCM